MKIFYIGMQRCGTKSFGDFFKRNGFRVCSWGEIARHKLGQEVAKGRWIDVLNSELLEQYDVFEDGPFWRPEFALFLSNYVKNSKFVYFHRPADDWYKSMVNHSGGLSLGDAGRHAFLYDRLIDLQFIEDQTSKEVKKLNIIGMKDHYTRCYALHKSRIKFLFSKFSSDRFYTDSLYNKEKFRKLNDAFKLNLKNLEEVHLHKSEVSFEQTLQEYDYIFKRKL